MKIVNSPPGSRLAAPPGGSLGSSSNGALNKVLITIIVVVYLVTSQRSSDLFQSVGKEASSMSTTTTTAKSTLRGVGGGDDNASADDGPSSMSSSSSSSSSSTTKELEQSSLSTKDDNYDPLACKNMVKGHCRDEDGKAWSYRKSDGSCLYQEGGNIPGDKFGASLLASLTQPQSVLDFGGGVGVYLVPFRDAQTVTPTKKRLVVVEPQPIGECILRGLEQDKRDWIHTPLSDLPQQEFDLTMSIEVLEHIPVQFHKHLIQALAQASRKYFVLSVAHPGQPGEGHVGPSMKERSEWIRLVHEWTDFRYVEDLNVRWISQLRSLLRQNAAIYQRIGT